MQGSSQKVKTVRTKVHNSKERDNRKAYDRKQLREFKRGA